MRKKFHKRFDFQIALKNFELPKINTFTTVGIWTSLFFTTLSEKNFREFRNAKNIMR